MAGIINSGESANKAYARTTSPSTAIRPATPIISPGCLSTAPYRRVLARRYLIDPRAEISAIAYIGGKARAPRQTKFGGGVSEKLIGDKFARRQQAILDGLLRHAIIIIALARVFGGVKGDAARHRPDAARCGAKSIDIFSAHCRRDQPARASNRIANGRYAYGKESLEMRAQAPEIAVISRQNKRRRHRNRNNKF